MYLTKLEVECKRLVDHITEHQKYAKTFFDKKARPRKFMEGNLVLLWDKMHKLKGMHHKFDSLWKGPLKIMQVNQNNSFILVYSSREILSFYYNGQDLKLYQVHNWKQVAPALSASLGRFSLHLSFICFLAFLS